MMKVRIIDIVRGTTVDGPGFRTSIYFAGCRHYCLGCHNPHTWDFTSGCEYTMSELIEIIKEEDFDVTLSGGDPLYHPEFVRAITHKIKELGYNIWLYTGYTIEEILKVKQLTDAVEYVDTIVEGRYIESLNDPDLRFRGSSNQRIIDLSI